MKIDEIIEKALSEDIGDGDHTSLSTIPKEAKGKAMLLIKEDGILAGMKIAEKVFKKVDDSIIFNALLKDGAKVKNGDVAFIVEGSSISILSAERLALNFMQRMSGIATATKKIVDKLQNLNTKVIDTRKTTPNMRILEKEAVVIGGGKNHRMGLYDMIMIKDNHVDFAGGIAKAIQSTKKYLKKKNINLKIEIEVRNFDELNEVLKTGYVDRIMLDNFTVVEMKKAIEIIDKRYETEASGGITIDTIRKYAETGVDYISVGALTHQIKSIDMSMKAI
ncbi:MAG: carboxylating nicotinate-nucleotide diphosphorylase [Bacteroidales bacterium]|nr:carboxylating nicotinate-nucleotide diphosphorylase [Bacteroidales bacterium]